MIPGDAKDAARQARHAAAQARLAKDAGIVEVREPKPKPSQAALARKAAGEHDADGETSK